MAKFFITTPIYYVNAKPHIGHMYSAVAADVLARWHKQKGADVLFSTGVDENSQKNVEAAQKQGKDVQAYVDEMAGVWKNTFDQLNLSYTAFIRTTAPEHKEAVAAMLQKIQDNGDIELKDYIGFYCVGCEEFKAEKDLIDGKCPIHLTEPKQIKEKNYFFNLSKYKQQLLDYYQHNPNFVQPESARNKMLYYIENEMEDVSISRQAQEWGIRMPSDPSHAVYVWFDALINYLTVTGYPQEGFNKWWPADIHIIGKDIIKFHCAIWPAMLLAAGLKLPTTIFAHGFFTIDGQKISKSLGNAIDPLDLAKEYPIDAIRYYLLREIPFGNDGDFSQERLKERYNSDLANGLGNLVSRTLNMIEKYVPDYDLDKKILTDWQQYRGREYSEQEINPHIKRFAFEKALETIWQLISSLDQVIDQSKPWEQAKSQDKKDQDDLRHTLELAYLNLLDICTYIAPFLPETHQKLTEILATRPLKKPSEPLFARKA